MTKPYRCALIGFSAFERSTFDSFFKLAARRVRGCEIFDDHAWSDVAIVNADDSAALAAFIATNPRQKVLLIGKSDAGTGWPVLARPIKLMAVLTEVNKQLGGKVLAPLPGAAGAQAAPAAARPPVQVLTPVVQRAPTAIASPAMRATAAPTPISAAPLPKKRSSRNSNFDAPSGFMGLDGPNLKPASPDTAWRFEDILVVDDSDIALKFMKNRLHRFGFRPELVSSGEEAMVRLAQNDFKFVFLDVMMQGMDGYQTCRAIKQHKYGAANPPVVVMLTSRGGTIDKIRGTLAGCDAYLTL